MIKGLMRAVYMGLVSAGVCGFLTTGAVVVLVVSWLRPVTAESVVASALLAIVSAAAGISMVFLWTRQCYVLDRRELLVHHVSCLVGFCLVLNMWFGVGGLVSKIRF